MNVWAERAARNEALFRKVNEEVAALEERLDGGRQHADFLCECADADCTDRLEVPLATYERVRSHPRRFIVVPGHETPEIEVVAEAGEKFLVVEKVDTAGEIAERHDPRA